MDALRGAAILLVIFGHAVQLASMYGGHTFTRFSDFIGIAGPLRMPLLFFLSGLLLPHSLAKGAPTYFRGKATKILHPYLVWSLFLIVASSVYSTYVTWWAVPKLSDIVVAPIEHLWFLAYLLVYYLIAYLTKRVNPLWMILGATMLMTIPLEGTWSRIAMMAVPFFLGAAVSRYRHAVDRVLEKRWLCMLLLATVLLVSLGSRFWGLRVPNLSWSIPLLLAFFIGVIGTLKPFGERAAVAPFRYIGIRSLIVYIVHWPVMLYAAPVLVMLGAMDPWLLFWALLALGIGVPVAVAAIADRSSIFRWLFAWNGRGPTAKQRSALAGTADETRD